MTWQDRLGSSAFIGCGSEKAAQVTGGLFGHMTMTIGGSEIRTLDGMDIL